MRKFTAIGLDENTGQIIVDHISAINADQSIKVAAMGRPGISWVVAISGHHHEGDDLHFPGEGVVSSESILNPEDQENL